MPSILSELLIALVIWKADDVVCLLSGSLSGKQLEVWFVSSLSENVMTREYGVVRGAVCTVGVLPGTESIVAGCRKT